MSSTDTSSDTQSRVHAHIPAILTTSFRAVTDAFGSDLVALSAHGSVTTTNTTPVEGLQEYFITRDQQTNHGITIEYTQQAGADGPHNPLTADTREAILEEVETVLAPADQHVESDLTVTSCTVRVTDEQLQAVTPARTPEFDLQFVANPAEETLHDRTKRVNAGRGLYSQLGFDIQHLNLHSVVETATKYHEQTDGRYYSWQGPTDIRPRAPTKLATRINDQILPPESGTLKLYTVAADEALGLTGTADEGGAGQPFDTPESTDKTADTANEESPQ